MIEQEQIYHKTLQELQARVFYNINNDIIKIFNILEAIKENPDNINSLQRVLPLSYFKTIKVKRRKSQQQDWLLEISNNILIGSVQLIV